MDCGLFNYIQACIFSRLKLLFNFYVKRTVRKQDFGAKFNLTFHNGAPVADILKLLFFRVIMDFGANNFALKGLKHYSVLKWTLFPHLPIAMCARHANLSLYPSIVKEYGEIDESVYCATLNSPSHMARPRGYFQIRRGGGKIWGKVRPSSPNKRKTLGSSVTKRRKSWEKSQFCSHIWISVGKIWGICHLYFWRQNLGLQQEFHRQILGPSPLTYKYESTPWVVRISIFKN